MSNRIVKNYIYNLGYQVFVIIVPLITTPYLARVLHSNNLGIYSYVTSCASIINTVGLLGLYNYGNRQVAYIRDKPTLLNKTFNELLSLRFLLCLIASAVYFIIAVESEYKNYFLLYYPWLLTGFIDISWFFAGIEDMGPMVFKNFIIKLLNVFLIFIFVKTSDDLWKYFLLVALITLIANAMMYLQLKGKGICFSFSFSAYSLKPHLLGAAALFLPQLASIFYLQVDKVMLKMITGDPSQVAFYDQAEKIVNIPFTVITALSVVMMPRIANEYKKGNDALISQYICTAGSFSLLISVPMLMGIDAIADVVVPWYLGAEYIPVINAIWIISPIIITNALINLTGTQYLTAVNKIKVLTISNFIAAGLNVIFNAILIPALGFYGAAVATVLSSAICACIQLSAMNKAIKVSNLLKTSWKYFVSGISMFFAIRAIRQHGNATALFTALLIIIGAIIYIELLFLMKDRMIYIIIKKIGTFFKRKSKP